MHYGKEVDYLFVVKANQKALLKQIESELLPKLTEQVRDRVLFNEADYQRNREEFRNCAIRWFRKIT